VDAETLAAWFDGGLKGAALEDVRAHVAGCDRCQMLLGAMGVTRGVVRAPEPERTPRRWLAWAVPLTAAAMAIAVWVAIPEQKNVAVVAPAVPAAQQVQQERDVPPAPAAAPVAAPAAPPPAAPLRKEEPTEQRARSAEAPAAAPESARDVAQVAPQSARETVMLRAPAGAPVLPSCGAEWPAPPAVAGQLTASSGPSMNVCWMAGRAGTILRSTDHQSWQRVTFPEMTDLAAVRATDAQRATVSTVDGRTFTTADGGMTWIPQ
jgi:hypothetical protein